MISVLLVDDEALVRAGLRMILETADDMTVVGDAEDGRAAVDAVSRHRPDVVLMDIRMPRLDGLAATAAIRARPHPPAVVVLTTFDTDDAVFRALEAGATGFLLKDTPPAELLRAVRHGGGRRLDAVARRDPAGHHPLHGRGPQPAAAARPWTGSTALTEREREVLVEIGLGHANAEIAEPPAHERGDGEEPRLAPVRQAVRDQPGAARHRGLPRRHRGVAVHGRSPSPETMASVHGLDVKTWLRSNPLNGLIAMLRQSTKRPVAGSNWSSLRYVPSSGTSLIETTVRPSPAFASELIVTPGR